MTPEELLWSIFGEQPIEDEDALEDEAHALNAIFDCVPFLPAEDDFYPIEKIRG